MPVRRVRNVALALLALLVLGTEASAAALVPVSRTLTAWARTGTIIDDPPDVIVGPEYGIFTHAASAELIGPPTITASVSVRSNLTESRLFHSVGGAVGSAWQGIVPEARGSVTAVLDVPEQTYFELLLYRAYQYNGSATGEIRIADGGPVIFSQLAPYNFPPPPPIVISLDAGRYEVSLRAQVYTSALVGGQNYFDFGLNAVPEPSAAGVLGVCLAGVLRRGVTRIPKRQRQACRAPTPDRSGRCRCRR